MTCPVCCAETTVYDSKPNPDTVCRRRRCVECGHKFRTVELDEDMLSLINDYQHRLAVGVDELTKLLHSETEIIKQKMDATADLFVWKRDR